MKAAGFNLAEWGEGANTVLGLFSKRSGTLAPWQADLFIITLQECKVSYLAATLKPLGGRIIVINAGWHGELSVPVSPHSNCEGTPRNMSAFGWLSNPKWNTCVQDKFMKMSANWSSVVLTTCQALGTCSYLCVWIFITYLWFVCCFFFPGSSVVRVRQSVDMLFVHKEVWQGVGVVFTLCLFTFNLDPSANVSSKCLL